MYEPRAGQLSELNLKSFVSIVLVPSSNVYDSRSLT